jgi:hypothetical protein
MKILSVAVFVGVALAVGAPASRGQPQPSKSGGTHESVECKVLKIYAAKDGDYRSRAYLVAWNGHEVIAEDPLARSEAHTDDTISVLVMHSPFPQNRESYGLLNFTVTGRRPAREAAPAVREPGESPAPQLPPSVVPLKVLKVYAVEDKGHIHRAYVVEWAGQEVVVRDPLMRGRYEEGATMPTFGHEARAPRSQPGLRAPEPAGPAGAGLDAGPLGQRVRSRGGAMRPAHCIRAANGEWGKGTRARTAF